MPASCPQLELSPGDVGDNDIKLVGGTFTFKGVSSSLQHQCLARTLRMAIYIHLSLLLEQHFLSDSNVQLTFPRPKLPPSARSAQSTSSETPSSSSNAGKARHSFLPNGILSFFSKKSLGRISTTPPNLRGGSLDLVSSSERYQDDQFGGLSSDGGTRRFSFISDGRTSFLSSLLPKDDSSPPSELPLSSALDRIEASKSLLSTSVGVSFNPPALLVELARKEKISPGLRLKGDERVGMSSILGWEGRDSGGKGMAGVRGFVRQQEFSVLISLYVPCSVALEAPTVTSDATVAVDASTSSSSSPSSSASALRPPPRYLACGRPRWTTYQYYSRDPKQDRSLGETIEDLVSSADSPCTRKGCKFKSGEHQVRYMHNGIQIIVEVERESEPVPESSVCDRIQVWISCAVCEAKTDRNDMNNGTL